MSEPFTDSTFTDDLHELMAIAIVAENRGADCESAAIFEAWSDCYPGDALGPVGLGIAMIRSGQATEGYALVDGAAKNATSRRDQAVEVLASLDADLQVETA